MKTVLRSLAAAVFLSCWLLSACQPSAPVHSHTATEMPDDFLGVVSYADAEQVRAWQQQGAPFVILDVRTEREFVEDGRAPDSVLYSYYLESRRRNKNLEFLEQVAERFAPDTRLLVMCSHGMRATQAAWELQTRKGFTNVHVFPGGFEGHHMPGYGGGDGWMAAGLPLEDGDD